MAKRRRRHPNQVLLFNFGGALQSRFGARRANQCEIASQAIGAQTHAELGSKFAGLIGNGHVRQTLASGHNAAPNAVVFIGSSSIRLWSTLAEDFPGMTVINRGFGGSYTTEVLGYMDRITLPYHPRVVVFHCGGNDVNAGDPAEAPLGRIREYVKRLRKDNPDTAVVFMATTRAPSRKAKWEQLDEYNRQLQQIVKEGKGLWYVDINPALNLPDGEPRPDVYLKDNLHPSEAGYAAMLKVIRPAVDAAWQATEAAYKR